MDELVPSSTPSNASNVPLNVAEVAGSVFWDTNSLPEVSPELP